MSKFIRRESPQDIILFCNFLIERKTSPNSIKLFDYLLFLNDYLLKDMSDKNIKEYSKEYKRYTNYIKSKLIKNVIKNECSDSEDTEESEDSDKNIIIQ
jgi:hypothetical protein